MSEKILGIAAGPKSIGWAIVEYNGDKPGKENKYTLLEKGVHVFSKGVKGDEDVEQSPAAERAAHRRMRVGYWRRKIRKIALLKILIENNLCPRLSNEDLKAWRSKKAYPLNEDFMKWQSTDDNENKNPYYCRNMCLTEKLDMSRLENRYIVGRAIYHINQRRGFAENRNGETDKNVEEIKKGIDALTEKMHSEGYEYLGQYFYNRYQNGEKIRKEFTSRHDHYEKELLKICEMQGLGDELTKRLCTTILEQRSLKSAKDMVGECALEPGKKRCPISHPLFEQYRMYQFVNNIKIKTPVDAKIRPLSEEEKRAIFPIFFNEVRDDFKFEEIAVKLSGNSKKYGYMEDKKNGYLFNCYMDATVSACPVSAQLSKLFDVKDKITEWTNAAYKVYQPNVKKDGSKKGNYEIVNDIWHALYTFDNTEKLKEFAKKHLQFSDEKAEMFSEIKLPTGYGSLSLKAIRGMLPYMKQDGTTWKDEVFMSKLFRILYPGESDKSKELLPELPKDVVEDVRRAYFSFDEVKNDNRHKFRTREGFVKQYLAIRYSKDKKYTKFKGAVKKIMNLAPTSTIQEFPKVTQLSKYGCLQLPSPRTKSLRNPVGSRSLFRLSHIVNTLLREEKIDGYTTVNIEFARDLNEANKRIALHRWQRGREEENRKYADAIREYAETNNVKIEPTPLRILKYRLWEEQNHVCLYTGKAISLTDLFDVGKFDIEHTIPRSKGGDSTERNLTICDTAFNRDRKKTRLPVELRENRDVLKRISHWKRKVDELGREIRKINVRGIADKELKDSLVQKRNILKLDYDYWKSKYDRFTMKVVPDDFSRRQGVDAGTISKYAASYLKSLFFNLNVINCHETEEFRKIWGVQNEYSKRERINFSYHTIDAITVACIGKADQGALARDKQDLEEYYENLDIRHGSSGNKVEFPKPWESFVKDIRDIEKDLLVSHYVTDNMGKTTRKRVRMGGKLTEKYIQGDTARVSLHQETIYGAIERDGEICYVVRKSLDSFDLNNPKKDAEKIVDDVVRKRVMDAIDEHGSLTAALEEGVWMNKEKGVRINKVRVYTQIKDPLHIRKQRDISRKEYKRSYNVVNEANYAMGIYLGKGVTGEEERDYILVNNLDAAKIVNGRGEGKEMLPKEKSGLTLRWEIKSGAMVLLYKDTPSEIAKDSKEDLLHRLYKVVALSCNGKDESSSYGTITLIHSQEARAHSELNCTIGAFDKGVSIPPKREMSHKQFKALIEGKDFKINELGEITFLSNE